MGEPIEGVERPYNLEIQRFQGIIVLVPIYFISLFDYSWNGGRAGAV
jgi:hypothetical protein